MGSKTKKSTKSSKDQEKTAQVSSKTEATSPGDSKKRKRNEATSTENTKKQATGTRLYVGNLAFDEKESAIKALLEECGTIENFEWVLDTTGKFKGICYVQYSNEDAAKSAIKKLDGKPRGERKMKVEVSRSSIAKPPSDIVFVGKIPPDVTKEELQKHFSTYGEVRSVLLKKKRSFATIEFADISSAINVPKPSLKFGDHELVTDFKSRRRKKPQEE